MLPVRPKPEAFFLEIGQFPIQTPEPVPGRGVRFLPQRLAFDLEPHDPALDFVEFDGQGIDLHAELRRGLVHQVDGLVGEEPVGDVPVGEHGGGHERRVFEADAMMDFVPFAQATEDGDGVFHRRLVHLDRLEAALEGRVLLDVLAILVEGGRADRVQFPARQHGLEHVRRVN